MGGVSCTSFVLGGNRRGSLWRQKTGLWLSAVWKFVILPIYDILFSVYEHGYNVSTGWFAVFIVGLEIPQQLDTNFSK